MTNWIYRRYRAISFFLGIVYRRWDRTVSRYTPKEAWEIAWNFWSKWPNGGNYRRNWKP